MIKTLLKPLSFLPALMLMYMIYSFSAQPGEVSSALSYKVSYKIVQTADYIFDGGHEEWQLSQWADGGFFSALCVRAPRFSPDAGGGNHLRGLFLRG